MKLTNYRTLFVLLALTTFGTFMNSSFAEETTGEKIGTKVDEVKKDMTASTRKAKKKVRDAKCDAGKKSRGECVMGDVKDAAQNAGDEVSHEAKKVKKKID